MKKFNLKFLKKIFWFLGVFSIIAFSPLYAQNEAYEIVKKTYQLKTPVSIKSSSIMFILHGGLKEVKEFELYSKKVGEQIRTRIKITKPIPIDLISWSIPGKGGKQWINLAGTFKEVAASDMSGSFLGSHFSLSDLVEPHLDDFNYRLLGESIINNDSCYKIEAISKKPDFPYVKNILYIRKQDSFIVQIDIFEKKGHTKTLSFDKVENIQGIITARKITMSKTGSKDKTIIILKSIEYNTPIEDSILIPAKASK